MSTFISIGNGRAIINLDAIAYIEDVTGWAVDDGETDAGGNPIYLRVLVVFSAMSRNDDEPGAEPDYMSLSLSNEDAAVFMAGIERRVEMW